MMVICLPTSKSPCLLPLLYTYWPLSQLPPSVRGLVRPIGNWWATTPKTIWNELLRTAAGPATSTAEKRKRNTAVTALRMYHDGHLVMTTSFGAPVPRGHCDACWDDEAKAPLRECRVYADRKDGQSAACVYCRINHRGKCNAAIVEVDTTTPVEGESAQAQADIAALQARFDDFEATIKTTVAAAVEEAIKPLKKHIKDLKLNVKIISFRILELEARLKAAQSSDDEEEEEVVEADNPEPATEPPLKKTKNGASKVVK
jgi:hypothetical protein